MRLISLGHAAVLVDTRTERILVDPWLTPRLDRFWERWPALPAGLNEELYGGLDAIVFTHHHFDHHHFPSLVGLALHNESDFDETMAQRSAVRCFYPRVQIPPRFTASGLGHQAIGWTLRRLGFTDASAVTPGDTLRIGETVMRTFPSLVPFPEMSLLISSPDATVMLCGDSLLHPVTVETFRGPAAPKVDLALVPAHSMSPPGVLTERRPVLNPDDVRNRSRATFMRYIDVLDATVSVPSSFGWRVAGEGPKAYGWANRTIFPLTPVEAAGLLDSQGRRGALCGPGQVFTVSGGEVELANGPYLDKPYDFDAIYDEVQLEPAAVVPPFDPAVDRFGTQRESSDVLVRRLAKELVGTDYWYRAAETGRTHLIEVASDDGNYTYLLDLTGERVLNVSAGLRAVDGGYTRIAGSTLQSLFDADLLFGSSFGLWVSTEDLLSAVFHHPRFYTRHVEKVL